METATAIENDWRTMSRKWLGRDHEALDMEGSGFRSLKK